MTDKNRNKEIVKLVLLAIAKGFAHATIMPILSLYIAAPFINNNYLFFVPFTYIAVVSTVYAKIQNKDISKKVFFTTLQVMFVIFAFSLFFIG